MPPAFEVLLLNTAVPQIQAAQAGDTYVVPRDIAFSAALTLSAGTANGVPYLNASKVLTSGSALTFNGTELGTTSTGLNINNANALVRYQNGSGTRTGYLQVRADAFDIWSDQAAVPMVFGVANSEQMRLTSTGLGIGTSSPGAKLHVAGQTRIQDSANAANYILIGSGANAPRGGNSVMAQTGSMVMGTEGAAPLIFITNAAEGMRLDASGNLGLGVTISDWQTGGKFQVGAGQTIGSVGNGLVLASNWYYNTTDKFAGTGYASYYNQLNGVHSWHTSTTSGSIGNNAVLSQAMTLDASGNLLVGGTSNDPFGRGFTGTRVVFGNNSGETGLTFRSGTGTASYFEFGTDTTLLFSLSGNASAGTTIKTVTAVPLIFGTNNGERARITSGGNFKIGGSADRATTEGDKQLVLFDGTAPVGTLANGISLYSSSGEAYVMDAAGNATLLSPHDAETNEWIFRSKHTPTGKVLKIDVERLLKFVNDHFGLDAVHEFIED